MKNFSIALKCQACKRILLVICSLTSRWIRTAWSGYEDLVRPFCIYRSGGDAISAPSQFLSMEAEPSTLTLSTIFLLMPIIRTIQRRFDFAQSRRSTFAVSNGVSLQTAISGDESSEISELDEPVFGNLGDSLPRAACFRFRKTTLCVPRLQNAGFGDAQDIQNGGNFVSNEARHRDIAALVAECGFGPKRARLAAKAIESHLPDNKAYSR